MRLRLPAVEVIGQPDCPILFRRTLLDVGFAKLLWHHFPPESRDRDPHDHPRAFVTLVVWGGYDDITECPDCEGYGRAPDSKTCSCDGRGQRVERLRAPAIRYRPATYAHMTIAHQDGARTLVVMGPLVRAWGFIRDGRWLPWREYEAEFGHGFRCEPEDALPDRPERLEQPFPEDLERKLMDPELSLPGDRRVHELLRESARADPEMRITRAAYLNLWALFDRETRS